MSRLPPDGAMVMRWWSATAVPRQEAQSTKGVTRLSRRSSDDGRLIALGRDEHKAKDVQTISDVQEAGPQGKPALRARQDGTRAADELPKNDDVNPAPEPIVL